MLLQRKETRKVLGDRYEGREVATPALLLLKSNNCPEASGY